ncbi:hypothetical protein ID866_8100 [Astraeus odoratus]|nr:hypothetical protein ID866_8100 [Astraeus odoratus]
MGSTKVFLFSTAIFLAFATYRVWKNRTRRGLRLPPGPKGLPLLGNIFDIDPARPWVVYTEWGKRYGGIVYTSLLGQGFLIINDEKIAQELLERRSSIYSDRPYFSMVDAFGMGFNTGSLSCGKRWRLHRKMFHATFNKQVSMAYKPMQMQKIRQYLLNLISAPEGYTTHSSIIMAITYGYDAAPKDDPFVSKSIHLLETALNSMPPEYAALLTTFPFLTYIPSWLPGGRHKLEMEKCCKLARTVLDDPVNYVKRNMVTGSAKKSLVLDLIENKSIAGIDEDHDEVMKEVAASVFIAGSDTTLSAILVFFLAMTLYPEVQTKAQEEIDRVIGQDRLPDFSDRENLPYIGAIVLETLRWYPILPLALPHATSTDDVFDGMYIPKGYSPVLLPSTY